MSVVTVSMSVPSASATPSERPMTIEWRAVTAAASAREVVPEDPLKIGGQFYMRAFSVMSADAPASQWSFSAPTLVDAYLDARPNERVNWRKCSNDWCRLSATWAE